jgi:predicted nuclease of predicted toxin-antitoxin system
VARLYSNENLPRQVVEALRRCGHDVLTTQETGQANRATPDGEVLNFATSQGRVVVTFNRRHFIGLHEKSAGHSGIIVCTYDPDFEALAARIDSALASSGAWDGLLARIIRPS